MERAHVSWTGAALAVLLLAGCTDAGQVALSGRRGEGDGDVAELRVEPAPATPAPAPGDELAWERTPLSAPPEAVREGLLAAYGLGFGEEPAGVHPGARWSATTGSAVRADDVVRTMTLLVDEQGRLRELTCLAAGPLDPDDGMLELCVDLVGLPADVRDWTSAHARRTGEGSEVDERVAGDAVVRVLTSGPWRQRVQSVQVRGARDDA